MRERERERAGIRAPVRVPNYSCCRARPSGPRWTRGGGRAGWCFLVAAVWCVRVILSHDHGRRKKERVVLMAFFGTAGLTTEGGKGEGEEWGGSWKRRSHAYICFTRPLGMDTGSRASPLAGPLCRSRKSARRFSRMPPPLFFFSSCLFLLQGNLQLVDTQRLLGLDSHARALSLSPP